MSLLRVDGLSEEFGGVAAVDDLSFEIAPGAIQSIIGPNGAGKTTLFNLITGVYAPTVGRVTFDGEDVTGLRPHQLAARGLARTFQNLQIFFNMTVVENVLVGMHLGLDRRLVPALLRLGGVGRKEMQARAEAEDLLAFVGLEGVADTDADAMSYGALKRLEIARALASKPRLILLDEPAAGLNPAETARIGTLIRRIAEDGVTVVLVEHDMRLVMGVSDRILVIDYGRRLTEGGADEVRSNPDVVAAYLGAGAMAEA